jgi:hypothetical protein
VDIYNAASTPTAEQLSAFKSSPRRVVLWPPEPLYRFVGIVGPGSDPSFQGNAVFGSPWWIPRDTFRQITRTAHHGGRRIQSVARGGLAVPVPKNPMDWMVIIELTKPVYAWLGPAKAQPVWGYDKPGPMLLGELDQALVLNLGPEENDGDKKAASSEAAIITYSGSGWSLV